MTKRLTATLLAAMIAIAACGGGGGGGGGDAPESDLETRRLWIGPERAECIGEAVQMCLLVAESADERPGFFYDEIEGLTPVEGTSYVVDVIVEEIENPPADGSSLRYTLVEIVEQVSAGG